MTVIYAKGMMFPFITAKPANFIGGECVHKCLYCWVPEMLGGQGLPKYKGPLKFYEEELKKRYKDGDFSFICDCIDLMAEQVPKEWIEKVLEWAKGQPKVIFLILTKNPARYQEFLGKIPLNVVLGATIETDLDIHVGLAPSQPVRLMAMRSLRLSLPNHRLFISVEPVLSFSQSGIFASKIWDIVPWGVAIGFDNYHKRLPEPDLGKVESLINALDKLDVTVYVKSLRKAWWETEK